MYVDISNMECGLMGCPSLLQSIFSKQNVAVESVGDRVFFVIRRG